MNPVKRGQHKKGKWCRPSKVVFISNEIVADEEPCIVKEVAPLKQSISLTAKEDIGFESTVVTIGDEDGLAHMSEEPADECPKKEVTIT